MAIKGQCPIKTLAEFKSAGDSPQLIQNGQNKFFEAVR